MDTKTKIRTISEMNQMNIYNRPLLCEKCKSAIMKFIGCGNYKCPNCGHIDMDDWGKVREYLYEHKNSTALDISNNLGIPRMEITQMLRESKIEVAVGSESIITCEICGKSIRSGKICQSCEKQIHENIEMKAMSRLKNISGTVSNKSTSDDGHMYFTNKQ